MKKALCLFLAVLLTISFSACQDGGQQEKHSIQTETTESTDNAGPSTTKKENVSNKQPDTCTTHRWGEWATNKLPTCNAAGTQIRTCRDCGQEEKKSVPKTTHEESGWIVTTKATANKSGKKHIVCLICNAELQTAVIPATGESHTHNALSPVVTQKPTCTQPGEVTKYCTCGQIMGTETLSPKHAIVTTDAVAATCGGEGWTSSEYCGMCGKVFKESQVIPQLTDHTPVIDAAVAATCTQAGSTQGSRCSACGTILQMPQTLPKIDHKFVNGICACGMRRPSEGLSFTADGTVCSGIGNCTDSVVVIPETYNGKKVTGIAAQAFMNNTTIEEIYIPDTVKHVGEKAFYNAVNLRVVRLSDNMDRLYEGVFGQCTSLKEITIPKRLTQIGTDCFAGCTNLKKVTMTDVTQILSGAFADCSSLTSLSLPATLQLIAAGAFSNCGFEEVTYKGSQKMFFASNWQWHWCSGDAVTIHCTDVDVIYYIVGGTYEVRPKDAS